MAEEEYFQGGLGLRVGDLFLDRPWRISKEPYRVDALDAEGYPVKVTLLHNGIKFNGN